MIKPLPAADFAGFTESLSLHWGVWALCAGIVVIALGMICAVWGSEILRGNRHRGDWGPFLRGIGLILTGWIVVGLGALVMIGGVVTEAAKGAAKEKAEEAKAERHITAFAYRAIGETIDAESHMYATKGSYTDAFPDLVGVEPDLNRFLVDDLVPKKRLELGSGAKSVMIEYTFYGPTARSGGQTLNVYLDEGAVTVSGCHAASWIGCKSGHWNPSDPATGRPLGGR